jgi:ATP-dependent DNA helicase RecQ
MALTATATERVAEDIVTQLGLGKNLSRYKASFNRPNLIYSVKPKGDTFNDLLKFVESHKGESGIIYCMSRASTEGIAERLASRGYRALAYHAGMTAAQRTKNQEMFIRDQVDIVCATIAFGMGIDKSNVRYVVHYDISKNIEGYYQETGRAGRDGLPSDCLLFYSPGDKIKISRLIQNDALPRDVVKNNLANLDLICRYAELRTCRKKMILEYFGEKQPTEHCGACDNCLGLKEKKETVDLTVAAQKFLSAIIRTSERFGATYITDVLTGNEKEERIIHNRHHTLPVFGIGADMKKTEWQHIARELEQEDYLVRDEEFGSLKLTTKGATALADRSPIHLVPIPVKVRQTKEEKQKAKASSAGISSTEPHEELFQLLRSVRKELAEQHNVPPYIIFHDSVLREVSKKMPRTLRQLDTIPGMGESKKKNYGEKIVAAVNTFCAMKKVA